MKMTRRFKDSWFYTAIILTVAVGELLAWLAADLLGLRTNPLVVGFLCIGLVAAITAVLYQDMDIG